MTKLCWKTFASPHSLASKVIKMKYTNSRPTTWTFTKGSYIWAGIGKGWDNFIKNITWTLGDGTTIDFWDDNWLGIGPLHSHIPGALPLHESNTKVRDFWDTGTWNLNSSTLASFLPPHILQLLHSSSCRPLGHKDAPYSNFAHKGPFQLGLAYSALKNPLSRDTDLGWIWKIKTYPKIKVFIWLCFWDRLPHKATLTTRGLPIDPSCDFCPTHENSLHILRDCSRAIPFWNTLHEHLSRDFFSLDLRNWLLRNLTNNIPPCANTPEQTQIPWPTLFSFGLWHLWLRRNEQTFTSKPPPPPLETTSYGIRLGILHLHPVHRQAPRQQHTTTLGKTTYRMACA